MEDALEETFLSQKALYDIRSIEGLIFERLGPNNLVLDAGCGTGEDGGVLDRERVRARSYLGVDLNPEALRENRGIDYGVAASLEALPIRDGTFDLIVSRFVFEHVARPDLALGELARVLKPGGRLVIYTYNIFHPAFFVSYVLPEGIRKWIKATLIGQEAERHTFPTYYRCNSRSRLRQLSAPHGLEEEVFIRWGIYFDRWKSRVLRLLFIPMEHLVEKRLFRSLRPCFFVSYVKR